jgi:hypothetical protein
MLIVCWYVCWCLSLCVQEECVQAKEAEAASVKKREDRTRAELKEKVRHQRSFFVFSRLYVYMYAYVCIHQRHTSYKGAEDGPLPCSTK